MEIQNEVSEHSRIYSIAMVADKAAEYVWKVRYGKAEALIRARQPLAPGSWVRFCGSVHSGIVVCDFVEVLDGIDVELLLRCIRRLSQVSSE